MVRDGTIPDRWPTEIDEPVRFQIVGVKADLILVPGRFNVAAVVNVYLPAQITMRETLRTLDLL